uniref:FZ domain-containing protein n=1 Tax=Rhizochromulina marina TaxID=1034831 RepID=A0A7S2RFQ7_9STRA|mmetsp:Transcript_15060/g.44602  ORF Transcript_15060/g.44602 Transcript_15060/m.44602 type:complete len:351 (+) Transcript_15060:71-1123(+)
MQWERGRIGCLVLCLHVWGLCRSVGTGGPALGLRGGGALPTGHGAAGTLEGQASASGGFMEPRNHREEQGEGLKERQSSGRGGGGSSSSQSLAWWVTWLAWPWTLKEQGLQESRGLWIANLTKRHERSRNTDIHGQVFDDSQSCGPPPLTACCNASCSSLEHCAVLNDMVIEDTYFPTLPATHGSCLELEERASRLDLWGDYRTNKPFKDTPQCRSLVLNYTCLTWATMFPSRCSDLSEQVPRAPCRSFCTEVATTCANDLDWINICHNIVCDTYPSSDIENRSACTPGPLDTSSSKLFGGCYVPKLVSPRSSARRATAPSAATFWFLAFTTTAATAVSLSVGGWRGAPI